MTRPWGSTVTIDDVRFNAHSVSFNFTSSADRSGMPMMGSLQASVEVTIDIHDDVNMPFDSLKKLFQLANVVTRDKIKPVKIELWKDESRQDAFTHSTAGSGTGARLPAPVATTRYTLHCSRRWTNRITLKSESGPEMTRPVQDPANGL